jgi:malate dehydrogenase (oxaloacetate-decarboxylating)
MNYDKLALAAHKKHRGKLEVRSLMPLQDRKDLSIAYTPGVAAVCRAIALDKEKARTLTLKGRTVAVVTDGSAILGLGNLGPEAALPVMEGKAVLFKQFAGVDAFPIALATQDTEEIIAAVKMLAPTFGGINLEDISAPRCFVIEERLKKELNIPVMHDDQHGTAIVVLAALVNALRVVGKKLDSARVVLNGAGAAGMAVTHLLMKAGVAGKNIIMLDSVDTLFIGRSGMNTYKEAIAKKTNPGKVRGGLGEALKGADVFIGISVAGALKPEWVTHMAPQPIVFAMANPDPEISFEDAKKTGIAVFGTGRSDYPNQINNVLAFPGIFRGALDAEARHITEDMKLAAAFAIAKLVSRSALSPTYVIPAPFDTRVAKAVARAVAHAAKTVSS